VAPAFLIANGVSKLPFEEKAAEVTLAVAAGQMKKDELTGWLRRVIE
jgi:hypothetical protein